MRFGLIGQRLDYSLSPQVHAALGQPDYRLFPLEIDGLQDFLCRCELDGFNVTNPYKQAILPFLVRVDEFAERTGVVNTVVKTAQGFCGYNTDVPGLKRALAQNGISFAGEHVLVLGSGATSLSVLEVCRSAGAASARRVSRRHHTEFDYVNLYDAQETTVIVHATPLGTEGFDPSFNLDFAAFKHLKTVVDVVYHPLRSELLCRAEAAGYRTMGGLDMLVHQAAFAEERFGNPVSEETLSTALHTIRRSCESLVLIGMPSCGKSTIGRAVARKLDRPFYDSDRVIEQQYGCFCAQLIREKGESAFRKIEQEILLQLSRLQGCVIATGGGSVLSEIAMTALRRNGRLYYLQRDLSALSVTPDRPLSDKAAKLQELFAVREPLYRAYAQVIVSGENDTEQIINDFLMR